MSRVCCLSVIVATGLLTVPRWGTCDEKQLKKEQLPVDEPGLVHKQMEPLAGSWGVEITYVMGGKEHKGKASCESQWVLDGRFLQQEYKSKFMGKPYTVLQHLGFDNNKKKTSEIVMQSLSTSILHNTGTMSADGKVITNEGISHDASAGQEYKLRTVTTIVDPDHYTLEWFHLAGDGKAEKIVSMAHTRRKSQPAFR